MTRSYSGLPTRPGKITSGHDNFNATCQLCGEISYARQTYQEASIWLTAHLDEEHPSWVKQQEAAMSDMPSDFEIRQGAREIESRLRPFGPVVGEDKKEERLQHCILASDSLTSMFNEADKLIKAGWEDTHEMVIKRRNDGSYRVWLGFKKKEEMERGSKGKKAAV